MFFTWCQAHLEGSDSDDDEDNPDEDNDDDNHGDNDDDPDDKDDNNRDDYENDTDDDDDDDYKDNNDDDDDDDYKDDNDDDNEDDNDDEDDDLDQVIQGKNREVEGPPFSFGAKEHLFVFVFLCSVLFPFYFHGVILSLIRTYLTFINFFNNFFLSDRFPL